MKKIVVFFSLFLIGSFGFSQIEGYNIESSKTYDNATKTFYASLDGNITHEVRACFEKAVKHNELIEMFRFYDAESSEKFMITASVDFTNQDLENLIQTANSSFEESVQASKVNTMELDILLFEIDNQKTTLDFDKLKHDLLAYDFIHYVAFGNNSECKIGVNKQTSEKEVIKAFDAVGLVLQ